MNTQVPEKQHLRADGALEVHSVFETIQGEGPFSGERAIFVRLAGCNLQCPQCDTDYTSQRQLYSVDELVTRVRQYANHDLVVITGGEPFRQNVVPFTDELINYGYTIQIETNGTLFTAELDSAIWVVCSPKTGSINRVLAERIDALKYVIDADDYDPQDGLPLHALGHTAKPHLAKPPAGFPGTIFLQPMDSHSEAENKRHTAAAVAGVIRHGYTLCLQTHKIAGVD